MEISKKEMMVLAALKKNGHILEDISGRATIKLLKLTGLEMSDSPFRTLLQEMEVSGLIIREVRGRRTFTIAMVDNEFPIPEWALEEVLPKRVDSEPETGSEPTPEPDSEPVQSQSDYAALAEAILQKVSYHYQNPVTITETITDTRLQENINRLQQLVEELTLENNELKRRLREERGKRREQHDHLTSQMKEYLPQTEWDKLMREMPRGN